MIKKFSQELYTSPSMRVIEVKAKRVLSASGGNTNPYGDGGNFNWGN